MPWGLKRYQQARDLHYIIFTCYHRKPRLRTAAARNLFEQALERVRRWYGLYVVGYVIMPEHVHLLVSVGPGSNHWCRGDVPLAHRTRRRMATR